MTRLVVLKGSSGVVDANGNAEVVAFDELRGWLRSRHLLARAFRYDRATLRVGHLETLSKPFATAAVLRILSRGHCELVDDTGASQDVSGTSLARLAKDAVRDGLRLRSALARAEADVISLERQLRESGVREIGDGSPIYIRSELSLGLTAGGSVGHIAGVLSNLELVAGRPLFITTDRIPTVTDLIDTLVVRPDGRFRDFADIPSIAFNWRLRSACLDAAHARNVSFVYQRYSAYDYSGLSLARARNVPFVLEYNGSEVWINRNWGRPLKYEALGERIELLNLRSADLVVVVSDVMRDELVERGVESERILVNPNGVDPDRYSPEIDGSEVRRRLDLDGGLVIGFIGTFGDWHGAENLAHAYNRLMDWWEGSTEAPRLLMIGDGVRLPTTRRIIEAGAHADRVTFTGAVPQEEGPSYLAACDILVSPHVPNADGTRFFGSPTKLFEYMAMGKPIVASNLEQIGQVLDHEGTAILVEPGDVEALATGIVRLVNEPELAVRLGAAARVAAVAQYTWLEHTRRTVRRLGELCA